MSLRKFLQMNIEYRMSDGSFDITGDVNKEGQRELIENFISGQMGKGADKSEPIRRDVYHIGFKWFPDNDDIDVSYNTGNKSLREGILSVVLSKLD